MLHKITKTLRKLWSKPQVMTLNKHQHHIENHYISHNALRVINILQRSGFDAFLVGGCVRDLLIGLEPKDFDVATNATPEQVRRIIRGSQIIGRRFKIIHAHFPNEIIEITTFRKSHSNNSNVHQKTGMLMHDNSYGTIEDDVMRRDFSMNALYFDPTTGQIFDFVNSIKDIQNKTIRLLGKPAVRYQEDPVRMLRAVRFAIKLDFKIESKTAQAISKMAVKLVNVSAVRLFDELCKLLMNDSSTKTYYLLLHYNLWQQLFPNICNFSDDLFVSALKQFDNNDATLDLVLAALLWPEVEHNKQQFSDLPTINATNNAITATLEHQIIDIHRKNSNNLREIWTMQDRFWIKRKRNEKLINHPCFIDGLDLLKLRSRNNPDLLELWKWWDIFAKSNPKERTRMLKEAIRAEKPPQPRKKPKSKRKYKKNDGTSLSGTRQQSESSTAST